MLNIALLTLGFIGLVIAALTPKSTVGAAVSLVSFLAYFLVNDLSEWYMIIVFILGIGLLILEVFIPGFGIIGMTGIGLIVFGLYQTLGDLTLALRDLSIAFILTIGLVVLLIRRGYSLANLNKIVLKNDLSTTRGFLSSQDQSSLLEQTGKTVTFLRPTGKAQFGEEIYDVLSNGEHIEKDAEVEVVKVEGSKIIVRRVEMNG